MKSIAAVPRRCSPAEGIDFSCASMLDAKLTFGVCFAHSFCERMRIQNM
jgi:hypothetical protein